MLQFTPVRKAKSCSLLGRYPSNLSHQKKKEKGNLQNKKIRQTTTRKSNYKLEVNFEATNLHQLQLKRRAVSD